MATGSLRTRRRERRLATIRNEALAHLIEVGVEGFSINKLADRVELTPGALYRYYDSRDALLVAVQLDVLDGFDAYLNNVDQMCGERSPLTRLAAAARAWLALAQLQPERFRLIARMAAAPEPLFDDEALRPAVKRMTAMLDRFSRLLDAATAEGVIQPGSTAHRAVIAWSSLQGLAERRKFARLDPMMFDAAALELELLRTLFCGWGATEEAVNAALIDNIPLDGFRRALPEGATDV